MISNLIRQFDASFALKDLRHLSYFRRIQLHNLDSSILLNQSKYVDGLLFKLELNNLKPTPSSFVMGKQFSISDGSSVHNPSHYRTDGSSMHNPSHY